MRLVLVLVVLIAPVMAVAVQGDPVRPQETTVLPFGVEDCTGVIALVKVPAALLQPYVPPGFRLKGAVPNLAIEADHCARMTTLDGVVEGGLYGSVWVAADPPPDLHIGPGGYFLGWDTLIPDEERRLILQQAGAPVHGGTVQHVAVETDRGAMALAMEMEGLGTFHLAAAGVVPPTGALGKVIQYNPSEDGTLSRWTYRWRADGMGNVHAGVLTVPEDSWLAKVIGTPVVPAQYFVGQRMTYDMGAIEFPIGNPSAI